MKIIVIALFIIFTNFVYGQYDTEFWFAVPSIVPKYTSIFNKPLILRFMTKDRAAKVVLSMPANPSFSPISINIAENSLGSIDLSPYVEQVECRTINSPMNLGFKINSTENVIAYLDLVSSPANAEFYSLKGILGLGTNFIVPGQIHYSNSDKHNPLPKNTIIILASEDSTNISIALANDAVGHSKQQIIKILLNEGQTYCLESKSQLGTENLTGTRIFSNKPITVLMNDDLVEISTCQDVLGDQLIPIEHWGKEFAVIKGNFLNETLLLISSENNNNVYVNNINVKTMARNELFYFDFNTNSAYVKSDYPIYVFHLTGSGCEIAATSILPFTCSGIKEIDYVFDKVTYPNNYLEYKIICKEEGINDFYLNKSIKLNGEFLPFYDNSDLFSGTIILSDYPYDSVFKLSNAVTSFNIGFMVGGGQIPGTKYIFLNDSQNDEGDTFTIKLPELNLSLQDTMLSLPIIIETKSNKFPIELSNIKLSFQCPSSVLTPINLKYGSFTTSMIGNKQIITCTFPYLRLNSNRELIDSLKCRIIDNSQGFYKLEILNKQLSSDHCNKYVFIDGYLNFECGNYSFTYDGFYDSEDLIIGGHAKHNNDYIRLTTNQINRTGTVFFKYKLSLDSSFTTSFRFRFLDGNDNNCKDISAPGADGIAFVITSENEKVGTFGGGIGYDGLNNTFALEFDTFSNDDQQIENFYDINGNHSAIQYKKGSKISSKHTPENTLAINNDIIKFNTFGTVYYCKVIFNADDRSLKVYLDSTEKLLNTIFELNDFDFSDYIDLDDNNSAYLGFTSATGCAFEIHDLLYWDFCSIKQGSFVSIGNTKTKRILKSMCCSKRVPISSTSVYPISFIKLIDLYGRVFDDVFFDEENIFLPQQLSYGVYFLEISNRKNFEVIKVLVLED